MANDNSSSANLSPSTHRHAIVTGGGSGIGKDIAIGLAEQEIHVTVAGRRMPPLQSLAQRFTNITAVAADVTDPQSVTRLFDQAITTHGDVNIVVANAGAAQSAAVTKTEPQLWNEMIAVNLTGVFLTLREALVRMDQDNWGRLINIASTAGLKGYPYVAAYCAAKHGVIGLTRAIAAEIAGSNITVNAVCPGFTDTPLVANSVKNIVAKTGWSEEKARQSLTRFSLLDRFVEPREITQTVLWLIGSNSDAITGQSISVSGGETM